MLNDFCELEAKNFEVLLSSDNPILGLEAKNFREQGNTISAIC